MYVEKIFYFIDLGGRWHKFILRIDTTVVALHEGSGGERVVALFNIPGKATFFYESFFELRKHPEWRSLVNFLRRTGN